MASESGVAAASLAEVGVASASAGSTPRRGRAWGVSLLDLWWAGGVGGALVAVDVVLRAYLRRPFWYDEIWRGHFVSEPLGTFWPELAKANTPSATGWVVMERLGGDVLGWHTWVLRLPGFVALPLLGVGITLLVGRFAGRLAGAFAALWICLNSTLLDLGTQLKPYTIETLAAVVAVLLWLAGEPTATDAAPDNARGEGLHRAVPGGVREGAVLGGVGDDAEPSSPAGPQPAADAGLDGPSSGLGAGNEADALRSTGDGPRRLNRGRLARRTAAGVISLFSVPAIFIIAPLAAADILLAAQAAWRRRRSRDALLAGGWRAVEALPALVLTAANTFLFVGHQSSQRLGHYWDAQFLAGRGLAGGLAFVGRQLRDIVTGTPPGIDRYDPSLLHPPTDGSWASYWVLAPAVVVCGLAGVAVLARRHDGRLLLLALGGAQAAMLAASAIRFWPFGPTRTNLFLVPLLVLVVVTGAATLVRRVAAAAAGAVARPVEAAVGSAVEAHVSGPARGVGRVGIVASAVVVIVAVAVAGTTAQISSASKDGRLYGQRDRLRGLDLTVDAAIAARRLYRPGDLVVVGGRLLRPGWIYAMEANDDAARRPANLPARPAGAAGEAPRIPRSDTVFFVQPGAGQVVADVDARTPAPDRILLFVFDLDATSARSDLADLRRSGWCSSEAYPFPQAGTLTVLVHCQPAAG